MTDSPSDQAIPEPEGTVDLIETDYEIGQDNIEPQVGFFKLDIHNPVFIISAVLVVAFVLLALIAPDWSKETFLATRNWVKSQFDWFFLLSANIFVIFALLLIVTPWGSVRLGGSEAVPDYSYPAWFAMLFAAGMGIGLMFFGVLEPVYYFGSPWGDNPLGGPLGVVDGEVQDAASVEAARSMAMAATIFHWGLHPWAIYAIVALALALFAYNKGLPLTLRSAFYPLLGERVWGFWGNAIDTIAAFATLFGLATSLGIGATQVASGLTEVFGSGVAEEGTRNFAGFLWGNAEAENDSSWLLVLIIAGITAVALISVVRGLDGGVKVLSEVNMVLAALLLVFVFLVGPTGAILGDFFGGLAAYAANIVPLSNPFGREDTGFLHGWTTFYWAWWISWSPFVGMFIARVSRGRTVREFVVCVLLIPSLVCVFWMATFGGTAISQVVSGPAESSVFQNVIASYKPEIALFAMLGELPLAAITSTLAIVLVIVFFVTSSDSGSLVIDTITAGGKVDAPVVQRVFWCIFEGAVAAVLLLGAAGTAGLESLQAMVISTGLLFCAVLLVMCVAIFMGLRTERHAVKETVAAE
ncbi:BCCT family transporter [Jannaschia seohaensis]|uniref:BCCT family betaine/carnitine transporter n=1 Tax=Jannaschia seohaensis TaxID=475081 RepID=A0A2Y9AKN6_9RHOB|nr:BCCT family transporter [Jannaschia seohaensis]PWJ20520.1 BCCT family betaine/carnitine transporter [Jannaschia seohaensis]SSA44616.1 betaine/carnitine transporter, BCCT family [Jannaschia seohaensis]